jgi:uncharacterized protein (TIGR03067 family)
MRIMGRVSVCLVAAVALASVSALAFGEEAARKGIEGKWTAVAVEKGGQQLPKEAFQLLAEVVEFEGGKMRRIVSGRVVFEADFTVDATKLPKTYEMQAGKDKQGRDLVIRGIYEIDKSGQLRICFVSKADAVQPKSFDTKATPGSQLTIYERTK